MRISLEVLMILSGSFLYYVIHISLLSLKAIKKHNDHDINFKELSVNVIATFNVLFDL